MDLWLLQDYVKVNATDKPGIQICECEHATQISIALPEHPQIYVPTDMQKERKRKRSEKKWKEEKREKKENKKRENEKEK